MSDMITDEDRKAAGLLLLDLGDEIKKVERVEQGRWDHHAAVKAISEARRRGEGKFIDPDIEEARKIAKPWLIYDDVDSMPATEPVIQAILAGIKRGRELATNHAAMRVNSNGER